MRTKSRGGFGGFIRRPLESGEMSLQITSMADIFMIILVFMLKSFSAGALTISPSKGLQIPQAQANGPGHGLDTALKLEVSERGVMIEGLPAVGTRQFVFDGPDLLASGASRQLSDALGKRREQELARARLHPELKPDPRVIVVADSRAPYATIKTVLASAALHGYTDFKLAVVQPD